MFNPKPIGEAISPIVTTLADVAADHHIVICAGAGLSKPPDTNLPLGKELAGLLYDRLLAMGQQRLVGTCDREDLLCIADAAESQVGGMDLLQRILPALAAFASADPSFGHRAFALLILEGAVQGITFNWDDCIERASIDPPRIQSVISDEDRLRVRGPKVLKTHGCITRAGSLLVSTRQLASPPTWVLNELGARLGDSRVVFIGVGDVPTYVQVRISQLVKEADPNNVYVVARTISAVWNKLLASLLPERQLKVSADEFLSQLINAYVKLLLARVSTWAADPTLGNHYTQIGVDLPNGALKVVTEIEKVDGATIVSWLRNCAKDWPAVRKVVHSAEALQCLCGASVIAAMRPLVRVEPDRMLMTFALRNGKEGSLEFVFANGQPSTVVEEVARRRIQTGLKRGRLRIGDDVLVVCHGHVGRLPTGRSPSSIIPPGDPADVLSGPEGDWVRVIGAQAVMDGDLPEDWTA